MMNDGSRLCAPCHFGLEAVLKRELTGLGFSGIRAEDGRVFFDGGIREAAAANVGLRTAERVMIEVGRFRAVTFDELFENVRSLPLENYIPKDGKFWVRKVSSVSSALFSPPDIQRIVKKAMARRLEQVYGISWFPETGDEYPFRIQIHKDTVSLCLDTSGDSLHKRGYRTAPVIAPLSETLAAALILLTPWKRGRILCDPCCGSGTIPIEAALIAKNAAPGLGRRFLMENWDNLGGSSALREAKEEAAAKVLPAAESDLQGFDIDPRAAAFARENARNAGVEEDIHFQPPALADFSHSGKYGFLIANPPYGERLSERKELEDLYRTFGEVIRRLDTWSMYLITSYQDTEAQIGRKADKTRKIYNGMIETRFYQYLGPKPPAGDGRRGI